MCMCMCSDMIEAAADSNDHNITGAAVRRLSEPRQSVFLWLLDLCLLISSRESVNKMNTKNLSIVIGPNL